MGNSYVILYVVVASVILVGFIVAIYKYSKKASVHSEGIVKKEVKAEKEEIKLTKVLINTNKGDIVLELRQDLLPYTVNNFIRLVNSTFYNGLFFHRVEPFLIQSGDPSSKGLAAPNWTLKLETNKKMEHKKYAVGMARQKGSNTASTQFYILKRDVKSFDGQFAVFGKVIKGFDVIETVVKGDVIKSIKEISY